MAINFNNSILSLYGSNVANDAAYQSPGTYGLSLANISGGIGTVTVGGTNNAYTSTPTFSVSDADLSGSGATFSVRMKLLTASVNAPGTVYAPGDTVTLTITGGTVATKPIITVSTVKLISATIAAGGTGYGNAQTFTATVAGGTSTVAATLSLTSNAGGVITTINSVSAAGSYTVLPSLTANAVTGGSGTGCTLNLVFGVNTITISTAGLATVIGTAATQFSTSGSGTGLTLNTLTWGVDSVVTLTPGTGYGGALTGTFGSGNATATVAPATSSQSENRILTLIDVIQSFVKSANSVEEVKVAKEIIWRMLARLNTGGVTPSLTTLATSAQRAGLLKYNSTLRSSF